MDSNHAAAEQAPRGGETESNTAQAELDFGSLDTPTEAPVTRQAEAVDDEDSLVGQTVDAFMDATADAPGHQAAMRQAAKTTCKNQEDSPPCANCGTITVRSGACYICPACGTKTGCG